MAYAEIEALALTQIQATTNFSSTNTSRGIYNILNSGKAKSYCILRPGAFDHSQEGLGGKYITRWTVVAELWVHLRDYGVSLQALEARRSEIIARFDQYRLAGDSTGNVQDVTARFGSDVFEVFPPKGVPGWLRQDISIEVLEESSVTLQE